MNEFNPETGLAQNNHEQSEASSNIFLDLAETDSVTGIPSLKQAPTSVISASESNSKVNTQLVIAMCVLAIGGGAIYGMRYIGMQAGLDENAVSIDYTSESDVADVNKRFTSVMRNLDESSIAVQLVSLESFADSPFARPTTEIEDEIPVDPGMSQEERLALQKQREIERQQAERKEQVISEAMRFKLQGIIGGSRPAARVSGQAVRVGMDLGEFFTVKVITGRNMIIEGDGMQFELAIGKETVQLD
jgi:hypothetical protein